MIGYIYKIISPSNKIYIGQTINYKERIKRYKNLNCKKQLKLYNSLKKYGYENHKFEILEECNREELHKKEIEYIRLNNSIKEGLNIREGGQSKIKNNTIYKHSNEFKLNLIKRLKDNKYHKDYKFTKEQKIKMSNLKNHVKKAVYCPELDKTWPSIREASLDLKINKMQISQMVNGKQKSSRNGLTFKVKR